MFVLQKKQDLTVSKTVSINIPDLQEKINDEKYKIKTPVFKLGNLDFYFQVKSDEEEDSVGFYICNSNNAEVIISMEVKEKTAFFNGQQAVVHRRPMEAYKGIVWGISHNDYRQWAAENGDVFKITATVTLHLGEGSSNGEEWTTLR